MAAVGSIAGNVRQAGLAPRPDVRVRAVAGGFVAAELTAGSTAQILAEVQQTYKSTESVYTSLLTLYCAQKTLFDTM